jgi:hypothetical protein
MNEVFSYIVPFRWRITCVGHRCQATCGLPVQGHSFQLPNEKASSQHCRSLSGEHRFHIRPNEVGIFLLSFLVTAFLCLSMLFSVEIVITNPFLGFSSLPQYIKQEVKRSTKSSPDLRIAGVRTTLRAVSGQLRSLFLPQYQRGGEAQN